MEQTLEFLYYYNDPNFSTYNYNINIYLHLRDLIYFQCLNFLSSFLFYVFWFLVFILFFAIVFYLISLFL